MAADYLRSMGTMMNHADSDWERSDDQTLGTYKRFMHLTVVSTVALVVLLGLMAIFLL